MGDIVLLQADRLGSVAIRTANASHIAGEFAQFTGTCFRVLLSVKSTNGFKGPLRPFSSGFAAILLASLNIRRFPS